MNRLDMRTWTEPTALWCPPFGGEGSPDRIDQVITPLAASDTRMVAAYKQNLAVYRVEPFTRLPLEPNADRYMGLRFGKGLVDMDDALLLENEEHVLWLDNSRPQHPRILGSFHPAGVRALYAEPWLYLGYEIDPGSPIPLAVQVWAINPHQHPFVYHPITSVDAPTRVGLIAASEGFLFITNKTTVADYHEHEPPYGEVIDARDPQHPQRLSSVYGFVPTDAIPLTPWEDDPWVAWALNLIPAEHILRISRASAPEEPLAELMFDPNTPVRKLARQGDVLYALTDIDLHLIDISSPAHPHRIGRYVFPHAEGEAHALKVVHGQAYVGIGRQLRVVDVRRADHLVETGNYTAPGTILGIASQGRVLTLAVDDAGIVNLEDQQALLTTIYLPRVEISEAIGERTQIGADATQSP